MPKLGMAPIRQKQLIDATYLVLHRDGIDDLTLKKIATQAGVATSIITHYFGTKEALIAETMSDLVGSLLREVRDRRKQAKSTIDEIVAIVDGNFAPSQVSPLAVSAWLYFWSRVPYDPAFDRMQRLCDYQLRKYLARSLKDLVSKEEADDIAETIVCLSYGFWLQFAHRQGEFDVARAHRMALQVIEARIQTAWQKNLHLTERTSLGG
ncbi:transcriptional regulator BetI [Aminobacter sp. SR38]|jgi:TetR/AcrR family transcriptional repressor of bet genes|uniref:transcriptional regulator BetI n=1 Tax=Aminobacter sp. SR38 TaxID=2774562 RepID=UPI00177FD183|nr:transcriptional regulator BetI [Aminobacter sp. SR38]QOF69979.1 transcriptional regulator BetI [Aminobacter sp. SR38]